MMEWLIIIGFLILITLLYVYLQKLVMKLPHKIWHFVPLMFFVVLTIYGLLRFKGIIIYYSDMGDIRFFAVIEYFTGIHGFLTSLITMIVIYLRQRKRPAITAGKIEKGVAVVLSVLLMGFTVSNVYSIVSYDYSQNTVDFKRYKLLKVSEYMFDKLHDGEFDTNTYLKKQELLKFIEDNKDSDVYDAVRYSDFDDIEFLDEHTVMICNGAIFQSVSGYLITDGQKNYTNSFYIIPGSGYDGSGIHIHRESDNIYYWSAGL